MRRSCGVRAATVFTAVAAVAGIALATAPPASADLTAELQDLALPAVTYSHQERTVSGRGVLTATDTVSSGSDGWQVTTQASGLRYSGLHNGTDLSAAHLAIASVESPVASDGLGEAVDPVGGPRIPATSPVGSLDAPRIVLEAQPGYGRGTYTQDMVLSLTLPPGTRTGTYTGTITTTISPGLEDMVNATSEPMADATAEPTASPEPEPTASSDPQATAEATPEPSGSPEPTVTPEPDATVEAASAPTASPEPEPTVSTGPEPTPDPTPEPTASTDPTP